ncbi:MAG: hypothetical protein GY950_35635, partial [bacterium]|nr:hypothetical protein [bacterium]
AAYPDYPNNYKAGWGYMLLTNFLPNGGNGEFTLHAVAVDVDGKTKTLGTKTITVDNLSAIKPFGALDTPTQGGTVSAGGFSNFGWALTPQPNSIPIDGSTIKVWIDGIEAGHPTYNLYREDIAERFPGYANSTGAVGLFSLDAAAYENGVHTIHWTVEDSAGNSAGIGSRYFVVQNAGNPRRGTYEWKQGSGSTPPLPLTAAGASGPVAVLKGYGRQNTPQKIYPDEKGRLIITVRELERLELRFFDKIIHAIARLPVGSTLDSDAGVFSWQPGVGFVGQYDFVFIEESETGELSRKEILINILPKFPVTVED